VIEDARQIEEGRRLDCDVCIIGGGAAGLTIARELMRTRHRVLVLESGGLEADERNQALYEGSNLGRSYYPLHTSRTRAFGGTTQCWSGMCVPLQPIDFEERDWVPHSGWPLSRADLDPYYRRAHEVLGLGPYDYDPESWQDADRRPFALRGPLVTSVFQADPPLRMGTTWRAPIEAAENVRVLLHANATNLVLGTGARTLDAVEVHCLDGPAFRVRALRTVLATGGIENARILLASNGVEPAGVGNRHDRVGRFFMEHPHTPGESALVPSPHLPPHGFYARHEVGDHRVWGRFHAPDEVLRRERILSFSILLFERIPKPRYPLIEAVREVIADTDALPGRGPSASGDVGEGDTRLFSLGTPSEQAPNPESRVTLDSSRDELGMRRAQLRWVLSPIDKRTIRRAHELFALSVGRAGLGRVKVTLTTDEQWPEQTNGGRHHMGTTRMSDDPRRGVVDAHGYVHGVDNLLVAGSSVFPTAGAANPTLTIVALALRMSDHLREVLS
jgi:choline dehydrogenase-like flavoprotein